MKLRRIFAAVTAAALTLAAAGCAGGGAVLSCGRRSINEAQFGYELALEKTSILNKNGYSADNASVWSAADSEGVTVAEASMKELIKNESLKLYFADYAEKQGYPMNQADRDAVSSAMDNFVAGFGSRSEFDKYMDKVGVNYSMVKSMLELQYMNQKGQQLLFGAGGSMEVTDEAAREYFEKNFITVKYVYVNNVNVTYPNGKTVPMTEAQKAEAQRIIGELRASLTPETMADAQSGDGYSAAGPETVGRDSLKNAEFAKAAFAAKTGAVTEADCGDGVYFILRLPLDKDQLDDNKLKELKTKLTSDKLDALYENVKDRINVNEELLNGFSFTDGQYFS